MKVHPHHRLAQETLDRIMAMIMSGEYPRDSRLPAERELAVQLNVSRPTLREAINVLEALGIVEIRHGSGVRVTGARSPLSSKLLTPMLQQDESLILELIEARLDFEAQNARLAAENATAEDIAHLGEAYEDMVADAGAGRPGAESDVNFHLTIAEATHNRVRLFITSSMFLDHMHVLQNSRNRLTREPRNVAKLLRHHRDIHVAIKNRDADAAEKAMRSHLESSYRMNMKLKRSRKK